MILLKRKLPVVPSELLSDKLTKADAPITSMMTSSGIPLLVNSEGITLKKIMVDSVFGNVIGNPVSKKMAERLDADPQAAYLIKHLLKCISENTKLIIAVTSVDQSSDGKPRKNSDGHLKGSAIDLVFMIADGEKGYVALDLMNSISFMSFIINITQEIFPVMPYIDAHLKSKPMIFGCEYDHIHIEMPWSDRDFPHNVSPIRLTGVPSGFVIGSFYNPQKQYGIAPVRYGNGNGVLQIFT